jgi:hypothetical protein
VKKPEVENLVTDYHFQEASVLLQIVLDPKFSQDSRVKISIDSCESRYEISVCEYRFKISVFETRMKRVSQRNLSARLARSESHYEISVRETLEKRISLLILTPKSREDFGLKKRVSLLARISKSDSHVNPNCWALIPNRSHISTKEIQTSMLLVIRLSFEFFFRYKMWLEIWIPGALRGGRG